ncbi:hypothetical protein ACWEIJ_23010 [Lentzea sp. NPDC004789]
MDLVWYVSYGSNMHADRFACYLAGGTPDGGTWSYPGCRDTTEPRRTLGCSARGGVYFATVSPVWRGGRAFYDPDLPGSTFVRANLITAEQFGDVFDQEMYRAPGTTHLDLREVLRHGRTKLGPGRYETLLHLGDRDGHPMLTFTAPWTFGEEPLVAPSGPYLRMLGHGLLSAHDWTLRDTADYLSRLHGVAGVWSPDEIIPMLYPYVVLGRAATPDATSTVTGAGDPDDLRRWLHDLAEKRGIRRLRVDGDDATHRRFLESGLADELHLHDGQVLRRHHVQRWEVREHPECGGPGRAGTKVPNSTG